MSETELKQPLMTTKTHLDITAEQVYKALQAEPEPPYGFISKPNLDGSLTCVTVDGSIDCKAIAEFLNQASKLKSLGQQLRASM